MLIAWTRYLLEAIFIFLPTAAYAFTFSAVQNGQCGPMTVTWSAGQTPFTIGIHPLEGTGKVIKVPDSQVSSGQGSMEVTLEVPTGKQFLVTMGDANGPLTGGTSQLLTSGSASGNTGSGCNLTYPIPDFFWSANAGSTVTQCGAYPFTEIGTASGAKIQQPATLLVLVPGGDQSFTVTMPNAPSYVWTANLKQGTQFLFDMTDSAGNQGGVGPQIYTIQSGDNSCTLHDASQKSSVAASSATATSTSSTGTSGGLSRGTIIGIACGGAFLAGLLGFLIFLLMRRKNARARYHDKPVNLLSYEQNHGGYQDLDPYDPAPLPPGSTAQPYDLMSPTSTRPPSEYSSSYAASSYASHSAMIPPPSGSKRAKIISQYSASQVPIIQHSDIADDQSSEPMELPPQYSPNRAPLQQYANVNDLGALPPPPPGAGAASPSGSSAGYFDAVASGSGASASGSTPGRSLSMRKGPR